MKKLKIIIASETYPPHINGAAKFSEQVALALARLGHEVVVIAPSASAKDHVEHENNLTIFRLKSMSLKFSHPYFRAVMPVNVTKKVTKIINDFTPDIIHVQNHFMLGRACLKAAKQNNIPIIGTGHFMPENLLEYMPNMLAKRAHRLMWNDFNKFYEQLDYVTSPSFAAQALLRKVGLKNNIEVISNGINLDNFKKVEVSEVDYVKFGLRKDVPTFIFVGRLEADKNVDLIIKATELVLKQKDIQVVIVGIGKDEKTFMKLAQDLNLNKQIIFTGKVSGADLRKLLSLADVYIGSGGAELQGIAVMEGMAMSLPILALNAVALPELVEVNKNGFLFEMDENDLADKMLQIIADESKMKEMGEQSLLLIQKHNQPAIMAKFVNLYESVIANKQIK